MKSLILLILSGVVLCVHSQSIDVPITHDFYDELERIETRSQTISLSTLRPFSGGISDSVKKILLTEDLGLEQYLFDEPIKKNGRWRKFYTDPPNFFSVREENFDLNINPIWQLNFGQDDNISNTLFTNSRGLEISGQIDQRIRFFSSLTENQIEYPAYVKSVADSIGLIPFEGFWKEYNETTTDFLRVDGYLDFNVTKHVNAKMGFGRHFIGSGERSMLLSDFSNRYPYLRLTTDLWKFKLTNIYASLIADVFTFDGGTLGSRTYPRKFMSAHYLELQLGKKLTLGLFESVIIGKPDSLGGSKFKPEYWNPIIFYRAVEQQDGSADNVLLGLNLNWTPIESTLVYGQFILDELIVSELTSSRNWWGNKYGYQIGVKWFEPIPKIDLMAEANGSRPFTYTHDNLFTSYTHYLQPLAHPMGANFQEYLLKVVYRPTSKLKIQGLLLSANYGVDNPADSISYGKNPANSYRLRDGEYGHTWNQGIKTSLIYSELYSSFMVKRNFFLDFKVISRREDFDRNLASRSTLTFSGGFRWNIPNRSYWF